MTGGTWIEELDRNPVTYVVLLAYVTLAFVTDPLAPNTEALQAYGSCRPILVHDGEPWRLLTYAFLHGGLLHLLFNGWMLFVFGPPLERRLGSLRFALLYAVGSLGGGGAGCLTTHPLGTLVGGSGALFGLLGAWVASMMRQGRHHLQFLEFQRAQWVLMLIAVNLLIGWIVPFISNAAHVGGLIAGFGVTFWFFERGRGQPDRVTFALRLGLCVLLAGFTLYALFPVLRWDWQFKRSRLAATRELREQFAETLHRQGLPPEALEHELRRILPEALGARGREMIDRWTR
jgi:membrane associated rhomboid family serine protease